MTICRQIRLSCGGEALAALRRPWTGRPAKSGARTDLGVKEGGLDPAVLLGQGSPKVEGPGGVVMEKPKKWRRGNHAVTPPPRPQSQASPQKFKCTLIGL